MRWLLIVLLVAHGLLHFLDTAKAFGWAELEELSRPVSPAVGVSWAVAGLLVLATAGAVVFRLHGWWWALLVAALASQIVIGTSWQDARFGTFANVVLLLASVWGFAAHGPWSLRAEYLRETRDRLERRVVVEVLTEADLDGLPEAVAGYIRRSGALGSPRVQHFEVAWQGRIRQRPDEPWMTFTAEQLNTVEPPSRHFWMDARRGGLPVDVLHAFRDGEASMRVRLLSLATLVHARGPEMTRAETVTLFNDLVLFAPGGLVSERIAWQELDERTVLGSYTLAPNTVTARLVFDDDHRLVDFVSDDRSLADVDGTFRTQRWSTPIDAWQELDGLQVPHRGQALWHPPGGEPYVYIEGDITAHEVDG